MNRLSSEVDDNRNVFLEQCKLFLFFYILRNCRRSNLLQAVSYEEMNSNLYESQHSTRDSFKSLKLRTYTVS